MQDALCSTGHADAAGRLLTQTDSPSWLHPVTLGATTIWERWDSMLDDGSINPGEMTSFNHYALGAVVDWLHRGLAGLAPAEPGYRRILVAPVPLEQFEHARAVHDTPYGRAEAGWSRAGAGLTVSVVVPANTTAEVHLPDGSQYEVGSGSHSWTLATDDRSPIRPRLTMSTPLSELMDDPAAFERVLSTIETHDSARARAVRQHTRWTPDLRIADVFRYDPHALATAVAHALHAVNEERAPAATTGL